MFNASVDLRHLHITYAPKKIPDISIRQKSDMTPKAPILSILKSLF